MPATMQAWRVHEPGPFRQALRLETLPLPSAIPGSVVIRTGAAGVNFPDILVIEGLYQERPELPFTAGFESAGEVVESASPEIAVGSRVVCQGSSGAFAEYRSVPAGQAAPVPDSMTLPQAAAFLVTFQTAYFALTHRAGLRAGETLLVHGAAGGVGSAAVQLGKALGATVLATAGGPEKVKVCKELGADHVIDHQREDFVARTRQLTENRGADVIFDPVGGDVFDSSLRALAWEGRLLVIGFADGRIPQVAANRILLKNISVVGLFWTTYWRRDPARVRQAHEHLVELFEAGKIRPLIGARFPLRELPDALELIASRRAWGKVVLTDEAP